VDLEKIVFFEDCLPPPAPIGFNTDADEPIEQTRPVGHVSLQTVPMQAHVPPVRTPTTDSNMVDTSPAPQHPRLVIRLPGGHMEQGALHHRCAPSDGIIVPSGGDSDSDDGVVFDQPIHDVAHVLDYLGQTLHSGRRRGTCNGSIAGLEHGGDGGSDALFVADNSEGVDYSPVAFSARLPGSIHLSQLPDPRSVCKALEAPDADGWKETMDRWVLHQKFMDGVFKINKASLVAWGNQQHPSINYDESYPTWWV